MMIPWYLNGIGLTNIMSTNREVRLASCKSSYLLLELYTFIHCTCEADTNPITIHLNLHVHVTREDTQQMIEHLVEVFWI